MRNCYLNMINENKIYGDGDNLVIFFKEHGLNYEMVYKFKKPIITEINIANPMFVETINYLDGGFENRFKMSEPVTINLKLKTLPQNCIIETSENGGLMNNFDIFSNVKVTDLFKIINTKLNKRKKNEDSN